MKKLTGIIMAIVMLVIMTPCIGAFDAAHAGTTASAPWDGTISQPQKIVTVDGVYYYEISTAEELAYIAQTGGEWLEYNYILANDIVLNDEEITYDEKGNLTVDPSTLNEWIPIEEFEGTFDGNNYSIYGIYVDTDSSAGFFGYCTGTVLNLNLKNSYVKGEDYVGGIISKARGNSVRELSFDGMVSGKNYVGGLIGYANTISINETYDEELSVKYYCYNYGDVFATGNNVGGIAGYIGAYEKNNCINYGNVTGNDYTAGIIGGINTTYGGNGVNYGNITGNNYVGGLCAYAGAGGIGGSNHGSVTGNNYVGGIVGYSTYDHIESWMSSFWWDCNTGTVTGNDCVGGISGYLLYARVGNCCNTGNVIGNSNVGAIIGKSEHIWGKGSVSNCYYLKNDSVNTDLNGIGNVADTTDVVESRCQEDFCYSADGMLLGIHNIVVDEAVEPACTETGLTEGKHCSGCNKVFVKQEIVLATGHEEEILRGREATCTKTGLTDGMRCMDCGIITVEQEVIPEKGHNYGSWKTVTAATCTTTGKQQRTCLVCEHVDINTLAELGHKYSTAWSIDKKASTSSSGSKSHHCNRCDAKKDVTKIEKIKSVKLSKTTYVYNGSSKNPTVVVKDSKGNIISSKNYTVTKEKGRKNVGKYTYKITFKNEYKGTKTLTFKINPKETSITKKPTAAKKAFTVKWNKVSNQATGYELMYSTSKNFTKKTSKTVTVKSYKTTSKKITGLKTKKTYYVKVRTYKTVGSVKYYSDWSAVKSVKTK